MKKIQFDKIGLKLVDEKHHVMLHNDMDSKLSNHSGSKQLIKPINEAGNNIGLKYNELNWVLIHTVTVRDWLKLLGIYSCRWDVNMVEETKPQLPTFEEIVVRARERQKHDMLGFEWQEYLMYLPFEHAKEWLKPDTDQAEWDSDVDELTRENVLKKAEDYMDFAFEKAWGERGISANRSVMHYIAWIWLAGDKKFSDIINTMFENDYCEYGKPILRKICEHYGWDPKAHGDKED